MLKRTFLHSSFFLLCILAFTLIISNVSFLFKIEINIFNIPISFILSIFLLIFFTKKPIDIVVAVIIALLISLISYYLANTYFDTSWDGQGYHQETIYLLKNGWNPIYQERNAFRPFINHYQKGNEIIQSNIYFITNEIESVKMLNLSLLFIAFIISFSFLDTLLIKKYFKLLISGIIILNPVVFTQLFTNYIDINWYLTLVISLTSLLSYFYTRKLIFIVIFIFSSVIFCSLKFSSIPVFVVFSLFALVFYFLNQRKLILKPFITIFILSTICNIHPFLTNLKNGYHILHPFAGENKSDILKYNIPIMLLNKNRIERLLISLFSKTTNYRDALLSQSLKFPFQVNKMFLYIGYDTRLGGFGFLFSGIFLITLLIVIYSIRAKSNMPNKKIFIIFLLGIFCTILINPASWWARLSAQIWLVPIAIIIFGLLSKNKLCVFLSQLSIVLFMINILIPGYLTSKNLQLEKKIMNEFINSVEKKTIILDLSNQFGFQQYYLKFKERNIKYKLRKIKNKTNLAPFTPDVYFEIEEK